MQIRRFKGGRVRGCIAHMAELDIASADSVGELGKRSNKY